jgi:anion-transporting  ArsA/GET3 family ATPase
VRDVLLTGKAKEAVRRSSGGRHVYDAVVMDAPPTGRITRFLNVNHEVAGLAKMGPIRTQADGVMAVIRSPLTAVHLVTVLEEMPVQETVDGVAELRAAGLPVGGVVVNMVREPVLKPRLGGRAASHRLEPALVAAGLERAGLVHDGRLAVGAEQPSVDAVVAGLLDEAADHGERVALERSERARLAELGRPTYELTHEPGGIDLGALYELAAELRRQGAA